MVIVFIGSLALYSTLVSGQCDQRDRGGPLTCCRGRNSTCAVERYDNESENNKLRRRVCFCDAFCEPAGDCCPDFARVKKECKIQGKFLIESQLSVSQSAGTPLCLLHSNYFVIK